MALDTTLLDLDRVPTILEMRAFFGKMCATEKSRVPEYAVNKGLKCVQRIRFLMILSLFMPKSKNARKPFI